MVRPVPRAHGLEIVHLKVRVAFGPRRRNQSLRIVAVVDEASDIRRGHRAVGAQGHLEAWPGLIHLHEDGARLHSATPICMHTHAAGHTARAYRHRHLPLESTGVLNPLLVLEHVAVGALLAIVARALQCGRGSWV